MMEVAKYGSNGTSAKTGEPSQQACYYIRPIGKCELNSVYTIIFLRTELFQPILQSATILTLQKLDLAGKHSQ